MAKMTIAETFDIPFHQIGQKNDGEPYYAVGNLRMEPLPAGAVEYAVDLVEVALVPPAPPSFAEAVGAGIKAYTQEEDIVGLRVTLTAIEADAVGSSDYWFYHAAQSALEDAIKARGIFVSPITVAEPFEQPLRWVRLTAGSEKYAVITLFLEPLPAEAVEYVVALSGETLPEDADPSCLAAVGRGVQKYAQEHGLVGVRVTLIYIQTHPVDSASRHFFTAAYMAMRQAIEAHGVPVGDGA